MKVLVEYETQHYWQDNIRKPVVVSEIRTIDDDCYPRVIGRLMREINDAGFTMVNIRCLDPHPNDLKKTYIPPNAFDLVMGKKDV